MCTIIALRGVRADYPLVLATNRDEFFARATSGPVRLLDSPSAVGGRDLVAGGTWFGVTQDGLAVGVTNQRTIEGAEPNKRSRGEIVLHALELGTASAVTRYVQNLDGREYNAFNLMWGDAGELFVAYARSGRRELEIEPAPAGIHVLPNDRLDNPDFAKVARARQLIEPLATADLPTLVRGLEVALADGQLPPPEAIRDPGAAARFGPELLRQLAALCVRTPAYGTRSSTITALAPGRVGLYLYADGPPDRTPFVDVLPFYHALPSRS